MFTGRQTAAMMGAGSLALFSVGCFGNKNQDAATTALAPPPAAAYPDTSGAAMAGSASAPGAVPSVPSQATVAATGRPASAPAPAPFSLREGEQLVPHQIQPGENLSTIATKYNTSVGRIQSANGMADTRIYAGKTIQVPTSAPPANLAQNSPAASAPPAGRFGAPAAAAPSAPGYPAPAGGTYPGTTSTPTVPPAPSAPTYPSTSSGAIAAPPVPSAPTGIQSAIPPGYPSSTSYPRANTVPATPSFDASRIQFSN